jgi:Ser/Thr protein kinase RdoA (MazF antagonist)
MVGDRPVTWWVELPRHRHATPAELGRALRKLHRLPRPTTLELRPLNPFNGFDERIHRSGWPVEGDRVWLAQQLAELKGRWDDLAVHGDASVIHGDAWQGNVAVADGGEPTLVDLEHVSLGIREWDLAPLAVDYTDFRRVSQDEYGEFVEAYGGYDVTTWGGYRTVADIQELRWVCFSLGRAAVDSRAAAEARHRIACLRGEIPRPWTWTAL